MQRTLHFSLHFVIQSALIAKTSPILATLTDTHTLCITKYRRSAGLASPRDNLPFPREIGLVNVAVLFSTRVA
jgi:hypothetical protein